MRTVEVKSDVQGKEKESQDFLSLKRKENSFDCLKMSGYSKKLIYKPRDLRMNQGRRTNALWARSERYGL